jgi:hypothetical protein
MDAEKGEGRAELAKETSMKVVINKCFGGFGLSPAGLKRWAELKGRKCYFFKKYGLGDKPYTRVSIDEATKAYFNSAFDIPNPNEVLGPELNWRTAPKAELEARNARYQEHSLYSGNIERTDPDLVKVVEELGKKANGSCAELRVVEIPDGTGYEIDEYDGVEHIAETHRTWG